MERIFQCEDGKLKLGTYEMKYHLVCGLVVELDPVYLQPRPGKKTEYITTYELVVVEKEYFEHGNGD